MVRPKTIVKIEPIQPKWITRDDIKKYLGCSDDFLETLRNKGEVIYSKLSNRNILYNLKSVEAYIERHKI